MTETEQGSEPTPPPGEPARDQIAAQPGSRDPIAAQPALTGELVAGNFPAALARLSADSPDLTMNRVTVAALNFSLRLVSENCERATRDLENERAACAQLREQLSAAERQVAVLQERLEGEQQSSKLRTLVLALGGAVFGFFPYVADKVNGLAGVATALLGLVLAFGAVLFKRKGGAP